MPANEKSGRPARPAPASRALRTTAAKGSASTKGSKTTRGSKTTKGGGPTPGQAGSSGTSLRRLATAKGSSQAVR
ncbi:MAG: hypothetical protein ACR2J5_18130, partial [Geodermatophilaceae bacterium]